MTPGPWLTIQTKNKHYSSGPRRTIGQSGGSALAEVGQYCTKTTPGMVPYVINDEKNEVARKHLNQISLLLYIQAADQSIALCGWSRSTVPWKMELLQLCSAPTCLTCKIKSVGVDVSGKKIDMQMIRFMYLGNPKLTFFLVRPSSLLGSQRVGRQYIALITILWSTVQHRLLKIIPPNRHSWPPHTQAISHYGHMQHNFLYFPAFSCFDVLYFVFYVGLNEIFSSFV